MWITLGTGEGDLATLQSPGRNSKAPMAGARHGKLGKALAMGYTCYRFQS
jgi:hypothetical protein